ncbi:uncharacterized protein LOC110813386 [Carica papaya]|uniref:uncharacterized protein LOC110813386 n=1 Tax=Carica papaya TaxID=3649 RepID=UPI000B8C7C38|nr:uncharacterized protein LOC110813386 [Carica papaya]
MEAVGGGAAAAATHAQKLLNRSHGYPWKSMEIRWLSRKRSSTTKSLNDLRRNLKSSSVAPPLMMPVYISTQPIHIDPQQLRELCTTCNYSCHRFPKFEPEDGRVEELIDVDKLRIALSHSSILVSVFCRPQDVNDEIDSYSLNVERREKERGPLGDLLQRVIPVSPSNGQLVGFGRAVSDCGLTASIYDVMVIPPLRRMGIGKLIVQRIVRMLTSRDIYDISALCSEHERLFFKACGFGDDILGSTTMMHTRTVTTSGEDNQFVGHEI